MIDSFFMRSARQLQFSGPVSVFQERRLPESATPAGYSALIGACDLAVPLPRTLGATGARHRLIEKDGWRIMTPRHAPELWRKMGDEGLRMAAYRGG